MAAAPADSQIDGRRAWLITITFAVTAALAFGIAYSFGTFFDEMAADLGASRSATATVFAITMFLFFGFGVVSGPLSDRYGPKRLLLAAAVIMGGGLVLTSRVGSLWLGYLTYGGGVGLGAGLYVTPGFAVVGAWFDRSRAMALGVASAGSGLGTLILVPTANRLISAYGWRTAYLVLGCVAFGVLVVASVLVERPPVAAPARGGHPLRAATGTRAFRLLFLSGMLMSLALFAAFAFVVPFAEDRGVSSDAAALLVSIVGASSVAGRVALSGLVRRWGPLRLYQACLAVQPVAYLIWLLADGRYVLLALFAALLGLSYGGFVALGPTVIAELFGVVGLGALLGVLYFGSALGGLGGPPLAGVLAERGDGQTPTMTFALVATLLAAAITLAVRRPDTGPVTGPATGSATGSAADPDPLLAARTPAVPGDYLSE